MISKYRRTINKEEELSNFWPTFTDLLATVLMVVIMFLISSESMVGGVEQGIANSINESVKQTLKENGIDPKKDLTIDTAIAFNAMSGAFIGGTGDFVTLFDINVIKRKY